MPDAGPPQQIQPTSLDDYLDVMSKAVFQSGISWQVVESKWSSTRQAFHDFAVRKVANLNERDLELLAQDKRVIRNARKLAAIVQNARKMLDLEEEHGSFQAYLHLHGDFDATLKALRRDFKFMGPSGIYYFLYVVGESVPTYDDFVNTYRK